jgi:hypothetical protein
VFKCSFSSFLVLTSSFSRFKVRQTIFESIQLISLILAVTASFLSFIEYFIVNVNYSVIMSYFLAFGTIRENLLKVIEATSKVNK